MDPMFIPSIGQRIGDGRNALESWRGGQNMTKRKGNGKNVFHVHDMELFVGQWKMTNPQAGGFCSFCGEVFAGGRVFGGHEGAGRG